jgi:hypothetical protein
MTIHTGLMGNAMPTMASSPFRLVPVFGTDPPADPGFTNPVRAALRRPCAEGVRAVVAAS